MKALLALLSAPLLACGSTLLDHDADPSLLALDCGANAVGCNGVCVSCGPFENGQPACLAGACGVRCDAGFNQCTSAPVCTAESGTSCGPSCADCTPLAPANASPACAAHACSFGCNPGYLKSGSACQRAVAVSAGFEHTCALTADGRVKCWGSNDSGQLGNGSTEDSSGTPVDVALPGPAQGIVAGYDHSCAVVSGAVYCWGDNTFGELGDGTTNSSPTPVAVSALTADVVGLGAGGGIRNGTTSFGHTCALHAAGALSCWGDNASGQLGDGTTTTRLTPVPVTVLAPGTAVASVACGERHTCAIAGGAVFCFGANDSGQLGIGSSGAQTTPATAAVPSGASSVATGQAHSCAVVGSGLQCWGLNTSGQVDAGNSGNGAYPSPLAVPLGTTLPSIVGTGRAHTCAADGTALPGVPVCFGADNADQLGSAAGSLASVSLLPPAATVVSLTGGENHTCVLTGEGGVQCWGADDVGQLGNGAVGGMSAAPSYPSGL